MYYHYYFLMIAVILKIDWMLLLGLTSDWLLVLKKCFSHQWKHHWKRAYRLKATTYHTLQTETQNIKTWNNIHLIFELNTNDCNQNNLTHCFALSWGGCILKMLSRTKLGAFFTLAINMMTLHCPAQANLMAICTAHPPTHCVNCLSPAGWAACKPHQVY